MHHRVTPSGRSTDHRCASGDSRIRANPSWQPSVRCCVIWTSAIGSQKLLREGLIKSKNRQSARRGEQWRDRRGRQRAINSISRVAMGVIRLHGRDFTAIAISCRRAIHHIRQREQRHHMRRVLDQPTEANLINPNWRLITRNGARPARTLAFRCSASGSPPTSPIRQFRDVARARGDNATADLHALHSACAPQ